MPTWLPVDGCATDRNLFLLIATGNAVPLLLGQHLAVPERTHGRSMPWMNSFRELTLFLAVA
jgi:thiol:disulfide interchange protein